MKWFTTLLDLLNTLIHQIVAYHKAKQLKDAEENYIKKRQRWQDYKAKHPIARPDPADGRVQHPNQ